MRMKILGILFFLNAAERGSTPLLYNLSILLLVLPAAPLSFEFSPGERGAISIMHLPLFAPSSPRYLSLRFGSRLLLLVLQLFFRALPPPHHHR